VVAQFGEAGAYFGLARQLGALVRFRLERVEPVEVGNEAAHLGDVVGAAASQFWALREWVDAEPDAPAVGILGGRGIEQFVGAGVDADGVERAATVGREGV
jgi:hypothetical protein